MLKPYFNCNNGSFMVDGSENDSWVSEDERRQEDKEMYMKIKNLLDDGADLSKVKMKDGSTFLIRSSEQGFTDTTRLLLSVNEVDINAMNNAGKTALDVAGNEDIKSLLLDAKKGIFPSVLRAGIQR